MCVSASVCVCVRVLGGDVKGGLWEAVCVCVYAYPCVCVCVCVVCTHHRVCVCVGGGRCCTNLFTTVDFLLTVWFRLFFFSLYYDDMFSPDKYYPIMPEVSLPKYSGA